MDAVKSCQKLQQASYLDLRHVFRIRLLEFLDLHPEVLSFICCTLHKNLHPSLLQIFFLFQNFGYRMLIFLQRLLWKHPAIQIWWNLWISCIQHPPWIRPCQFLQMRIRCRHLIYHLSKDTSPRKLLIMTSKWPRHVPSPFQELKKTLSSWRTSTPRSANPFHRSMVNLLTEHLLRSPRARSNWRRRHRLSQHPKDQWAALVWSLPAERCTTPLQNPIIKLHWYFPFNITALYI